MKVEAEEHRLGPGNVGGGRGTSVGARERQWELVCIDGSRSMKVGASAQ